MATNVLDTDSEDELPAGWEERVTATGKVYYANHNLMATQWDHPISGKKKKVAGELPFGWEKKVNETGHIYYVDHINKKTTYTDPRLAFAVEDKKASHDNLKQRFDGSSTAQQVLLGRDLTGRYVIVTGGNSGIGYETARSLALHGAHVVIACRDLRTARTAVNTVKQERAQAQIQAMHCDLASLSSVREFAKQYLMNGWPLHILILNAGVFSVPYTRTEDGFEKMFQVNHLGHFYLTQLMTPCLVETAPARVVVVTSESHRFTDLNGVTLSEDKLSPPVGDEYRPILAYNQSKLCNVLLAMELQRRLGDSGVSVNAVHPGNMVSTGLSRHWWGWWLLYTLVRPFAKSKQQAASTVVFCATARELEAVGGGYFNNCFRCPPANEALAPDTAARLWDLSEAMIENARGKDRLTERRTGVQDL